MVGEIEFLLRRQMFEVKIRDAGCCVSINDNAFHAGVALFSERNARKAIPLDEFLVLQQAALGVVNVQKQFLRVVGDKTDQQKREYNAQHAAATPARYVEPDRGGKCKQDAGDDHGVRTADPIQQWDKDRATGRCSYQIEEVNPLYAIDGIRNCQRHDSA